MRIQTVTGLTLAAITAALMAACGDSLMSEKYLAITQVRVLPVAGSGALRGVVIDSERRIVVAGTRRLPDGTRTFMLLARFFADGTLDPKFGQNGIVEFLADGRMHGTLHDVILDSESRIVGCGFWYLENADPMATASNAALVRFTADGQLDSSFGNGGVADLPPAIFGVRTACTGLREVAGQYFMAGAHIPATGFTPFPFLLDDIAPFARPVWPYVFLARFDAQGMIDPTFGLLGAVQVHSDTDFYPGLDRDSQGRLYVRYGTGGTVETYKENIDRFMADGTLDSSYGDQGRVSLADRQVNGFSHSSDLAVSADGDAWVSGSVVIFSEQDEPFEYPQAWKLSNMGGRDSAVEINSRSSLAAGVGRFLLNIALDPDGAPVVTMMDYNAAGSLLRLTSSGKAAAGERLSIYPRALVANPFTVVAGALLTAGDTYVPAIEIR